MLDEATSVQPAPEISDAAIAALPGNVLAAVVTTHVRYADSVGVRFGLVDRPLDSSAPAVLVENESSTVPVLGLLPDTGYIMTVVAYAGATTVTGAPIAFRTSPLPDDLPAFTAGGADPSAGYVAFAAGRYALAIDNTGRVVWYHAFAGGAGLNFMPQVTGTWFARPPTEDPEDRERWVEIDPLGDTVSVFDCARGLSSRFHDLIVEPDGAYWIMCDEVRTMDLTSLGGAGAVRVTGTVVQHIDATGELAFEWSPFDHFDIADLDAQALAGPSINWTHGNAITLDHDGHLLVSFRNLDEITKIDTHDGSVIWRMGGRRTQFAIDGSFVRPFARQHGVRVTASGELLLLDNSGDPLTSRAERYAIDERTHAVELTASFTPIAATVAATGGSTQPLPGGRTLVSYGSGGRVEEYDAAGSMVWRLEGSPGYVFRATRIWSLYTPGK